MPLACGTAKARIMVATVHPIRPAGSPPSLDPMMALVAADMNRVNEVILARMQSDVPLIPELAGHLIAGGGKRMRPMLTLASARLLDYSGTRHHRLAAAVEFIHTATLLHDDVVEGFNQVIQLDPTNLQLLREHGQDMLPRWYGKDEHSLERFALWAMEATQQTYGRGAYAYIYGLIAILGVDVDETVVNVELLDAGYSDLRQRFPCLNLENEHANAMSWADAESRVLSLFNEGLRIIDYRAWGGDDEAEGMEYALNAYTYARDNG